MSEKSVTTYAILHLHFTLRVSPDAVLAHSREAASVIAFSRRLDLEIIGLPKGEA